MKILNLSFAIEPPSATASATAGREGTAVNVGRRQNSRLASKNVIQSSNEMQDIYKKIKIQYGKKFKSSQLYGTGDAGKKILQILKKLDKFSTQKIITY